MFDHQMGKILQVNQRCCIQMTPARLELQIIDTGTVRLVVRHIDGNHLYAAAWNGLYPASSDGGGAFRLIQEDHRQ